MTKNQGLIESERIYGHCANLAAEIIRGGTDGE